MGKPGEIPSFDLDGFIDECRRANDQAEDGKAVQDVVARAISDSRALLLALGEPSQGGIQTIYRSPGLTVLNIVWSPQMQLMPHEHNMWSVIGIYTGREDNIFWRRDAPTITAFGAASLVKGNTMALRSDVIHSVVNPIEKLTGAIHAYGGDFFEVARSEWDPETLAESPWNIEKARRLFRESNERFTTWKKKHDGG